MSVTKSHFTLITLFAFLIISKSISAENIMEISGGGVDAQDTLLISINIQNDDDFTAFQSDIQLPDQFSYLENSAELNPDRSADHQLQVNLTDEGVLSVFGFSVNNALFTGNSGAVASFKIVAGSVPGNYTLALQEAIIGGLNGSNLLTASVNGSVTIYTPDIQISTDSISFGEVPLETTEQRSFQITNQGNEPLVIDSITIDNEWFTISESFPVTISNGGSINLNITFDSQVDGTYNNLLKIYSNDPDEDLEEIILYVYAFNVNELHCGSLNAFSGDTTTLSLSINNMEPFVGFQFDIQLPDELIYIENSAVLTGRKTDHQVGVNYISNNEIRAVAYSPGNESFSGEDGDIITLDFLVDGTGGYYGLYLNEVIIADNNGENVLSDFYNGSLQIAAADISTSTSLDFGEVSILDTASQNLTISNYGQDTLEISNLVFSDSHFFTNHAASFEVLPSQNETIEILFHDPSEESVSGNLTITSNDPDENPLNVSLAANTYIPNTMSVDTLVMNTLDTAFVDLNITNYEEFVGFQVDISYPDLVECYLDSIQLTDRAQDHALSKSVLSTNKVRIFAYSMSNAPFSGSSGPVLVIPFISDESTGSDVLVISDPIIANANSENILYSSNNGEVTVNLPLSISEVSVQHNSCYGDMLGEIHVSASGGSGDIQYSINNGDTWQAGGDYTGLAAGEYNIWIKDANESLTEYDSNPVTLTEPNELAITSVSTTDIEGCYGESTGSITILSEGGTGDKQYSINDGATWQTGNTFVDLAAGDYTILVEDENDCQTEYDTNPVTLTQPLELTITSVNTTDIEGCYGESTGTITILSEGGTGDKQYSIDDGATWQAGYTFADLVAGNYNILVKDANDCQTEYDGNPVTLTEPSEFTITSVSSTNIEGCYGESTGSITILSEGGTGDKQYSIDDGATWQTGNTFAELSAGDYSILVKDENDCQTEYDANPVTLTEPTELTITSVSTTDIEGCYGESTGSITILSEGGTGDKQYSIDDGATWQAGYTFADLVAGNYNILVKDANDCQTAYDNNPVTITQPDELVISSVNAQDVSGCFGNTNGQIDITATGGTGVVQYSIDNGNTWSANMTFDNLAAGDYNILIKDENDCQTAYDGNPVTLTEPTELTITSVSTTDIEGCYGEPTGSITILSEGGTGDKQYSIDDGATWQAGYTFADLVAGNYNILVKDENDCQTAYDGNPVTLTEPTELTITSVSTTDIEGCYGEPTGSITILSEGGTGDKQYSIDDGATWQAGNIFADLAAGNYNVLVKDANDCQTAYNANPVTLTEPTELTITSVSSTNIEGCFGESTGSITILSEGGTGDKQYSIDDGATWQAGNTFADLSAGDYTILVKDENNCQTAYNANPVTITQPLEVVIESVEVTNVTGYAGNDNGSITILATGGSGIMEYSINNGDSWQTNHEFTGLVAGAYEVAVKDAHNCLQSFNNNPVIVNEPDELVITSVTVEDVTGCYGNANGSIVMTAEGGVGEIQYSIDGGSTWKSTGEFTDLQGGTYECKVKDSNGTISGYTNNPVIVNQPEELTITSVNTSDIEGCFGEFTGSITILSEGGTGDKQYSIDDGATWQTGNTFASLSAGDYNILVKDENDCQTTYNANPVTLTEPTELAITSVSTTDIEGCYGESTGTITILSEGGTGNKQYSIDDGVTWQNSNTFTDLAAGDYEIQIKDANECQTAYDSNPVTLAQPTELVVTSVSKTDVDGCYGDMNGGIQVFASGGTGAIQYSIDDGSTWSDESLFTNLGAGDYSVMIKDENDCEAYYQDNPVTISQPEQTIANAGADTNICATEGSYLITDASAENFSSVSWSTSGDGAFSIYTLISPRYYPGADDYENGNVTLTMSVTGAPPCTETVSDEMVLTITPAPYVDAGSDDTICSSNSYILEEASVENISALYWTSSGTGVFVNSSILNTQYTPSQSDLVNGSVVLTLNVVGVGPCDETVSDELTLYLQAEPIEINTVQVNDIICHGEENGIIQIDASGGTGQLQYSINNGSSWENNEGFYAELGTGEYEIEIKDSYECIQGWVNNPVSISEPSDIIINVVETSDPTCVDCSDGFISITANGGTGTLNYSINGGETWQNSENFEMLGSGEYNLIVKDENDCIQEYENNPMVLSAGQKIVYQQGWNMTSFAVEPEDNNMQTILQPLIDNDHLLKVIDEQGNIIEEMPWGWVNNIGAMSLTEGYYLKLSADDSISVEGELVNLPYDIPLTSGWNMIGYPAMESQNASEVFSSLMNDDVLIKVIDEQGQIIEELPWGWVDNIGTMQAGEGYYVKVNADAVLTIEEPAASGLDLQPKYQAPIANHFIPVYQGNPYEPMQVVIDATSLNLKQGDELSLFSNGQCVGAAGFDPNRPYQYLTASKDDAQTGEQDGYLEETSVTIKVYRKSTDATYHVPYERLEGPTGYTPLGSLRVEAKSLTTGTGNQQQQSLILRQNRPNPFTDKTTIGYYLPQSGQVELTVYNLHGQKQRTLVKKAQARGEYKVSFNGNQAEPGVYVYKLMYDPGSDQTLKILFRKMTIIR